MSALTLQRLRQFAPHGHSEILNALCTSDSDHTLIRGGINNTRRLANFLGNVFVESAGLTTLEENLHYSASRLTQVWPSKFNSRIAEKVAAGGPEAIANYVYGGRMGNNAIGDGWKYRGSGLLQLTGKDNYIRMSKLTGLDLVGDPELARDIVTCLDVACQVWNALKCNEPADANNFYVVRQRVNGGQNSATEVKTATWKAISIFKEAPSIQQFGIIGDAAPPAYYDATQTPIQTEAYLGLPGNVATASGPEKVPMTARQAKTIQGRLKDKNYNPGDVDGNIHSPSTVGAIATIQKQNDLPVTGLIDEATEDAIQNTGPKTVPDHRAIETVESLRAKGSQTIADADAVTTVGHGVVTSGGGLLLGGLTAVGSAIKDQLLSAKETTDGLGITDKVIDFVQAHLSAFGVLFLGLILILLAHRLYKKVHEIKEERVKKSRTGVDMSH